MGHQNQKPFVVSCSPLSERRGYPRFKVALRGVCSIAGGGDQACAVVDLSLSGAMIEFRGIVAVDAEASLLLPHIGLLNARVARTSRGGFGVEFTGTLSQRRRVQNYLSFVLQMKDDDTVEGRAFERIVPLRRTVEIRCVDGRVHMARIRDVSRSGSL